MSIDSCPQNTVSLHHGSLQKAVRSMVEKLLIIIGGIMAFIIIWLLGKPRRYGCLFIEWYGRLCQAPSCEGIKLLREHRRENVDKSLDIKFIALSRFFLEQLKVLFKELEIGREYRTTTHLIKEFKRKARKKEITIIQEKKQKSERYLFWEALRLFGMKDFCKILFSNEHRPKLMKQFYKITFTRNK